MRNEIQEKHKARIAIGKLGEMLACQHGQTKNLAGGVILWCYDCGALKTGAAWAIPFGLQGIKGMVERG